MRTNSSRVPEELRDRTWYEKDDAYAFLVDAPHTFGHSQLVVTIRKSDKEEDSFSAAACHIAGCIKRLRMSLPKADDPKWKALARYTRTSGPYEKTLLLRVSVDENRNEYKIHLVPYFKSHLDATNRLYQDTHHKDPKAKGGLLHWLGLREVILDYDMRDGRKNKVVQTRIKLFHLQLLASKLREDQTRAQPVVRAGAAHHEAPLNWCVGPRDHEWPTPARRVGREWHASGSTDL